MDMVEQAVACALSPQADPAMKQQAMSYCEQLKASPDGWQLCLGLFVKEPKSSPDARLFALQVIEVALGNSSQALDPQQLQFVREALVNFVNREFRSMQKASVPKDPQFLRNKLAHTLTLLFLRLYPHSWPSFFDDLVGLLDLGSTANTDENVVDMYFRILMAIDEEVVNLLVPREKDAAARNVNIKDAMRERDIITIANTWPILLNEYRTRDPSIAAMLLRVVGAYITWIDISLVVNESFMNLLYGCLEYHPEKSRSRELQVAACNCFTEIINKGMKSHDKLALLQLLQPNAVLSRLGVSGSQSLGSLNLKGSGLLLSRKTKRQKGLGDENDEDDEGEEGEEFELTERSARLANAVGVELCRIHEDAASAASSGSPEADSLRRAAYAALEPMFPFLLHYLGNEYDDTSSCVFPFLGDVLGLFRRIAKVPPVPAIATAEDGSACSPLSLGFPASPACALTATQRNFLLHILQAVVLKMKHTPETDPFAASSSSFASAWKQTNGGGISPSPTHAPIPGAVGAAGLGAIDDSVYGLFVEMRKQLKVFYDSIAAIDRELWLSFVHSAVSNVLGAVGASSANGTTAVKSGPEVEWVDVELAIHLVFLMGEAERGAIFFVTGTDGPQQQLTPFGDMMVKLMQSDVSAFPHPAIQLGFFESVVRYWQFYDQQPEYIGEVLHAFIDERGLRHAHQAVRARVYYLFHRYTKHLRARLMPYASIVLNSLGDLLAIHAELGADAGNPAPNGCKGVIKYGGLFDSQLYLFEAVGMLISLESWAAARARSGFTGAISAEGPGHAKEAEMLEAVLNPVVSSTHAHLNRAKEKVGGTADLSRIDLLDVLQLHHLTMVIGSVAKGFPDVPKGTVSNAPYTAVFKQATDVTLLVLESLRCLEMIREAARFTFARLSNKLGSAIVPYIPRLITSLLADCHAAELVDFLPFTGLLVHRFSPDIAPTLSGILVPLVERVFMFLNTTPSGTDEAVLLNDLKKSYLGFLSSIFNAEVEGIFVDKTNMPYLNTILQSVLHYAADGQDIPTSKLAFGVLNKMVAAWGGGTTFAEEAQKALKAHNQKSGKAATSTGAGACGPLSPEGSSQGANDGKQQQPQQQGQQQKKKKEVLPGFDQVLCDYILPLLRHRTFGFPDMPM